MNKKSDLKTLKNKKILIVCSLVCAVIVAGYLALCVIAGGNDFIGDTVINGVNVSDMSKQEAISALEQQFGKDKVNSLTLSVNNDKQFTINTDNAFDFNATKGVEDIYKQQHSSFLKQGILLLSNTKMNIPVTLNDQNALETAINESGILDYDTSVATKYTLLDKEIEFVKGKEGVRVTLETVLKDINNALAEYKVDEVITCTLEKSGLAEDEMTKFHGELSKECVNATLDKSNKYAIVPSQIGITYNLDDAKKAFENAKEGESFKIPATITQPKVTTEKLQKNLFKDVLGSYTTYVDGIDSRRHNVKLSGEKVNGTILLPGEEFSYNGVVGRRTAAAGFGVGGAYVNGEVVEAIGGGICQTSSTIYNAAMLSNLQITVRKPHTYKSGYVPIGMDATVSWGGPDFRFKNNTDYPIKIVVSYVNHRQTVKIYGTDLENITVKITSTPLKTIPFPVETHDDFSMAPGTSRVTQVGVDGGTAQTYRHVYKNGVLISTTKEAYSSYKPKKQIVYRNPNQPVQPEPDVTPPDSSTPDSVDPTPSTDGENVVQ